MGRFSCFGDWLLTKGGGGHSGNCRPIAFVLGRGEDDWRGRQRVDAYNRVERDKVRRGLDDVDDRFIW